MHINEALFTNEAFYVAFAQKDITAMEAIWSPHSNIVCIHPGWPALTGRAAVLGSWRSILANDGQPSVSIYDAHGYPITDASVTVVCYEMVAGSTMVAVNVFTAIDGEPKLVSHQAGPCHNPPPFEDVAQTRI